MNCSSHEAITDVQGVASSRHKYSTFSRLIQLWLHYQGDFRTITDRHDKAVMQTFRGLDARNAF